MAAALTERCVMAAWALSPAKLKAPNFQLEGRRQRCAGLYNSTPPSVPSEAWKAHRTVCWKGPR